MGGVKGRSGRPVGDTAEAREFRREDANRKKRGAGVNQGHVACRNGSLRNARRLLLISWGGIADTPAKKHALEILAALESLCTTINALGGIKLAMEDCSQLTDDARKAVNQPTRRFRNSSGEFIH